MKLFTILIIILLQTYVQGYGESDSNGNPNYFERESFNLVNLVRMQPVAYKTNFMGSMTNLANVLKPTVYPAVKPFYYSNAVNRLAKAHSFDMASTPCFAHNDCNGTATFTRFTNFLACSSTAGAKAENIAYGSSTGISVNNLLICEASSACVNDGVGDGHRKNIMSTNYATMGVGYYKTTGSAYWTQDFLGSSTCATAITTPIYSGYHTFYPSVDPIFIVNFYHTTLVSQKMELIFGNGTVINMPLTYGTTSAAIYTARSNYVACQKYYFKSTSTVATGSVVTRYPDTGFLQTSKTTTCAGWSP